MQAKETKFQELIEGTKQFVVPLYQRIYSWQESEWKILLEDIKEIYENETPRPHFIGSIVTIPTISVPEGVTKYLLIDGQQRITTIFILLTVIRDLCQNDGTSLADEITNTLLVNQYKKNLEYYKLLPTQSDREAFNGILSQNKIENSLLTKAYNYFKKQIIRYNFNYEKIKNIITNYFSVVSIVLDPDDNPYLVFESLNAKGRKLEQADLIRNYFLMVIHVDEQEKIYNELWFPVQELLQESLTEFIRHFLMKDGGNIKQNEIYYTIKNQINSQNVKEQLKEIYTYSTYYDKILHPKNEQNPYIQKYLIRLNTFEVTTAYPLLLYFYNKFSTNKISQENFINILATLENYLVRRFICNYPSNQLNKIFSSIQPLLANINNEEIVKEFKRILQNKKYPTDDEFNNAFLQMDYYAGGERISKIKFILQAIEDSFSHKEFISNENLTIEHIMPQTLTKTWKQSLGEEWENTHTLYVHNIGNLTLTAYNSELSNKNFDEKKIILSNSHLELNKYFTTIQSWGKEEIIKRNEELCNQALTIWNYFGDNNKPNITNKNTTKPNYLYIRGSKIQVDSWREVLVKTLNNIYDIAPEDFNNIIAPKYKKYLNQNKEELRKYKELTNGYYVEVNLNAKEIQRLCYNITQDLNLSQEDWYVETQICL